MALAQIWGIVMGLYIGLPPPHFFRDDTETTWGFLPVRKHRFCFVQCTFQLCGGNFCVNPLKTAFEILSINGTWQLWRGQLGVYYK